MPLFGSEGKPGSGVSSGSAKETVVCFFLFFTSNVLLEQTEESGDTFESMDEEKVATTI